MLAGVDSLTLDLLEWIGSESRPYSEVMEAWRTSCPRLPVWENANELGFVERRRGDDGTALIAVSPSGWARLREHRRESTQPPVAAGTRSAGTTGCA